MQTLDATSVEAARGSTSGEVVGFYRTTPTSGVSMSDEDKALAAGFFRDPASVFLLVEAGKSSIGDARFCFWGDGQLFDWPLMLFPFDAEELAVEEERRRSSKVRELSQSSYAGLTQVTAPADEDVSASPDVAPGTVSAPPETEPDSALVLAPEPLPVPPVVFRQESNAPEPVAKPQQGTRSRWLAAALAMVVAVAIFAGAFFYFRRSSNLPVASPAAPAQAEVKATLGLAVERRGNDLRVSWNGNAPLIEKADFGMLLIRGRDVSRDVPLTAGELRSGSVVYASPVDEVRFQLNVVVGEQVTREFLTIVLPKAESRVIVTSSKSSTSNAGGQPQPPVSSASAPLRELRQFKPVENPVTTTATPLRIEEPPSVGAAPANIGTPALLNQRPVSLPAAPVEVPVQRIPQAEPPRSTAVVEPPSSTAVVEPTPSTVGAYPPVATNKVVPPVPALLRGVLWKPVVVDVTVSVNASGNVVKAEVVAKPGVNPLLSDAAVQAARRWKFRPAQFDGHPVPADIVLQFNFAAGR